MIHASIWEVDMPDPRGHLYSIDFVTWIRKAAEPEVSGRQEAGRGVVFERGVQ
jgi:hypothetical protein